MDRSLMDAIRQQSDDLRDELKDLEQWEEEVSKKAEARRARKAPVPAASQGIEPPIRGTVSSIKQAMSEEAKKQGKELPPEQDPVQLAKEKGNEYFRLGNTKEAVEAYGRGIDLDPHSATTHVLYGNRAMCYIKLGEWEKAEKDATMCVQLNRGYAKGYFRRGLARKNLGKLKEARADLESVLALVPNDASAIAELEVVTKRLQAERARTSAPAATKKKIVIEEVDDEDEDEEDEGGEASSAPVPNPAEEAARNARIQKQLAELEESRKSSEEAKRAQALKEEKTMEARRRNNHRVEIVEEEEEVAQSAKPVPEPPAAKPIVVGDETKEATKTQAPAPKRHTDSATPASSVEKNEVREEPAKAKRKAPASSDPAVAMRIRALPTKESLKPPRSFSEFERDYSLVEKDEGLRDYYVSLMSPATLASLFGSSMTPEMLTGILRSVKSMTGPDALRFLKGLSKVNRIGELALFFNDDEEKLIDDIASLVRASGASDAEVKAATKALKPF